MEEITQGREKINVRELYLVADMKNQALNIEKNDITLTKSRQMYTTWRSPALQPDIYAHAMNRLWKP